MAEVRPAGPDPTMMMSRGSMSVLSRCASRPAEPAEEHADSAQGQPRRPDLALVQEREAGNAPDSEQHERREHEQGGDEPDSDAAGDASRRLHRLVPDRRDRTLDGVGGSGGPVRHARSWRWVAGAYPPIRRYFPFCVISNR